MLRIIREEEPPKPSTRLTRRQELPTIAASRGRSAEAEPAGARRAGLDRDEGAREGPQPPLRDGQRVARDVERYLDDEPVLACPPSAWYRLRKFGRRNRGTVLAGSLLFFGASLGFCRHDGRIAAGPGFHRSPSGRPCSNAQTSKNLPRTRSPPKARFALAGRLHRRNDPDRRGRNGRRPGTRAASSPAATKWPLPTIRNSSNSVAIIAASRPTWNRPAITCRRSWPTSR